MRPTSNTKNQNNNPGFDLANQFLSQNQYHNEPKKLEYINNTSQLNINNQNDHYISDNLYQNYKTNKKRKLIERRRRGLESRRLKFYFYYFLD
jgi:hypothetical protein